MKNIYLLVGPSGSGKTTIATALEKAMGMKQVASYTERLPRYPGEEGHTFVTPEEFDKLEDLCAYTEFNGYRYGPTAAMVDECDIYVIDPAGVKYMKEHYHGDKDIKVVGIFATPKKCAERMLQRGDVEEKVQERIQHDRLAFAPTKGVVDHILYAYQGLCEICDTIVINQGNNIEYPVNILCGYICREEAKK